MPLSPLAVVDRVGLQREDQGVDRRRARGRGCRSRRSRSPASTGREGERRRPPSGGDDAGDDVGALLADGGRPPSGRVRRRRSSRPSARASSRCRGRRCRARRGRSRRPTVCSENMPVRKSRLEAQSRTSGRLCRSMPTVSRRLDRRHVALHRLARGGEAPQVEREPDRPRRSTVVIVSERWRSSEPSIWGETTTAIRRMVRLAATARERRELRPRVGLLRHRRRQRPVRDVDEAVGEREERVGDERPGDLAAVAEPAGDREHRHEEQRAAAASPNSR